MFNLVWKHSYLMDIIENMVFMKLLTKKKHMQLLICKLNQYLNRTITSKLCHYVIKDKQFSSFFGKIGHYSHLLLFLIALYLNSYSNLFGESENLKIKKIEHVSWWSVHKMELVNLWLKHLSVYEVLRILWKNLQEPLIMRH